MAILNTMSMSIFRKYVIPVWNALGSVRLTILLCLALCLDLIAGYVCLDGNSHIFSPMNETGLQEWAVTYGMNSLPLTAWFFILLGLLFFLSVNTFICTTERLYTLFRARKAFTRWKFACRLAPHLMHYAMIIMLLGYLTSYLFSQVIPFVTLIPGSSCTLPDGSCVISLERFEPVFSDSDRLGTYRNRVIEPRAFLKLTDGNSSKIRMINGKAPLRFAGYNLFLMDFSPKKKGGGMSNRTCIVLLVRKDPGVIFYMTGVFLFSTGLLIYVAQFINTKKDNKEE